ncbi:MAG: beta-propeller domain-containing protein [Candidatus Bathyarchaeota archaeon]
MKNSKWFIFSFLATLLIISSVPLSLYLNNPQDSEQTEVEVSLNKFSSYEELKTFLETTPQGNYPTFGVRGMGLESNDALASPEPAASSEAGSSDYSKTNIQVEGVDEADIVKTDGEYIYIVSGGNVTIVKAYPAEEAEVVSKISLNGSIMGIFINGDKLAIFHNEYTTYLLYDGVEVRESSSSAEEKNENTTVDEAPGVPEPITYEPPTTSIKVYDISDRENPVLTRDFSIDGNYFSSRMIGDYVYVVATMYTFFTETDIALPRIQSNNETEVIPATDIYYCNLSDSSYSFTTIVALNIQNDSQEPTHETIVLGGTSNIYVSQNNIYLTFTHYSWQEDETTKTTIQRIRIEQQTITFEATGEVPGYVLNQFLMDEHNGYFRTATTVNNVNWRTFTDEPASTNNVYVLDMNLNVVGKLEGLAPGEQIYSARFMGDRCYLVTFRQIDPFFVIDVANPTEPKVLGYLKIPGFSGYLHPYDENHIIGIGKQDSNVKLSLFDVTDVTAPTEIAKYIVEADYSDSPVLYDHKAFLFDKPKQLLAIPVSTNMFGIRDGNSGYWQGAYIFDISLEQGFTLEGEITHQNVTDQFEYDHSVKRILYIDDVLYTISSMKVKMNNLETLTEINEIDIS